MKNLFFALAVAIVGLTSCDLEPTKVEPTPVEISYYSQYHYSQFVFNDVVSEALKYTKFWIENPSEISDEDGVKVSYSDEGNVLTIEYPADLQKNPYKGKFKVIFNEKPMVWPLTDGASMEIEPVDLTFNWMKIAGNVSVDILEKGDAKAKLKIAVVGGKLTDRYNASIMYGCNLSREQKEGEDNKVDTDDTYTYTGTASGAFSNSISYSLGIDSEKPLIQVNRSYYLKSGKVSVKLSTYAEPFTIEHGTTKYANEVLFTYKGVSKLYQI